MAKEYGRQTNVGPVNTPDDGRDLLGLEPQIMTRQRLMQSQAGYTGNQHADLVEIEIERDGKYVKRGDVMRVHPTTALIFREQGLISGTGRPIDRKPFENKDITREA